MSEDESKEVPSNTDYAQILHVQRQKVVQFIKSCLEESRSVEKQPRREQNKLNWNYFHGTIDWSHKRPEDPRIHLHKVGVAAERLRAKIKGALMKYDQWLTVERRYHQDGSILPEFVAKNLVIEQLSKAHGKSKLSDAILRGALESRIAVKLSSKQVVKPRFVKKGDTTIREEKTVYQMDLPVMGFEQLHIDVDNQDDPIYIIEEGEVERYRIEALASDDQSADKPYNEEMLEDLGRAPDRSPADEVERAAKGNENQFPRMKQRNNIVVHNYFGHILDDNGSIMKWKNEGGEEVELKNIFCVVANEDKLLIDPTRNTRLSAKSPYIYSDILRSPNNGRKALLDAGTTINQAIDELMSLMLAGAIKSVHNVTWYRPEWIEDKRALSGGIKDGAQLPLNGSAPPGMDPVGTCETGKVPQEAFAMKNSLEQVFAENVLSSQTDMGQTNTANKLATELNQMSTAISDIFDSIGGDIEEVFMGQLGEEALYDVIQNLDDMDEDEVKACFGDMQQLADQFLQLSPKDRFKQVSGIFRFSGKGLRGLIANQAKAQALINLVNTMMANPMTAQSSEMTISVSKLLMQIAKGFGLDVEELAPSEQEKQMIAQKQMIREQALAQSEIMGRQTTGQSSGGSPSATQPGSGSVTGSGAQNLS